MNKECGIENNRVKMTLLFTKLIKRKICFAENFIWKKIKIPLRDSIYANKFKLIFKVILSKI